MSGRKNMVCGRFYLVLHPTMSYPTRPFPASVYVPIRPMSPPPSSPAGGSGASASSRFPCLVINIWFEKPPCQNPSQGERGAQHLRPGKPPTSDHATHPPLMRFTRVRSYFRVCIRYLIPTLTDVISLVSDDSDNDLLTSDDDIIDLCD